MDRNQIELNDYLEILQKNKHIIILFAFVCVVTTAFFSILQSNIYRATAVLLIDKESANVLNVKDVVTLGDSNYWSYKEYLKTQVEILKSRSIIEEVFKSLNLEEKLMDQKEIESQDQVSFIQKKLKSYLKSAKSMNKLSKKKAPLKSDVFRSFSNKIIVNHKKDTRLLTVSFENKDPALAADITNSIIDVYIRNNLKRKINASKSAVVWLSKEVENLRVVLKEKEKTLQKFRKQNNIISADERREIINENLVNLSEKLTEAESRFAENKKRYRLIHPKMKQLMELVSSLNHKLNYTRQEAIAFEEKLIKYSELVREVNLTEQLLENVLTREKEAIISGSIKSNNISVIEKAEVPTKKIKPRRKANVFIALIIGLCGGIFFAFVFELLKKHIHNSEDFTKHNVAFLGYIPFIKKTIFDKNNFQDNYLLLHHKGIISEIFNNLRTSIILKTGEKEKKKGKSIVFTSFVPGEGKTLISSNLSVALAKYNFKTLLLEADLRRSRIKDIFEVKNEFGISDYLLEKAPLDSVIQNSPLKNLDLMLNYSIPENPSELLGSARFKEMLEILNQKYDLILIDAPPVFAVTDPILLTALTKNVVVIAKYNSTPKNLIPLLKEKLDSADANILGAIINQVKDSTSTIYNSTTYYGKDYISH